MPFKFHPPTRKTCSVCESIGELPQPIIDTQSGKASAADNFPIHNWFNFTLGYTPEFPDFLLERESISGDSLVVDPFLGSGTTAVCAKSKGLKTAGVEANDFFASAAKTKLEWDVDTKKAQAILRTIEASLLERFLEFDWPLVLDRKGQPLLSLHGRGERSVEEFALSVRPLELVERYISDAPLVKLEIIRSELKNVKWPNQKLRNLFELALAATILPVSNVRYGPGFGVIKAKEDAPVLEEFLKRAQRMIQDLELEIPKEFKNSPTEVILGDARKLSDYFALDSVDIMITSPPYPGDHEYTKHSRLELMFMEMARSKDEFRVIKKRMLRGSTTNIYKADNEGDMISHISSIQDVVNEIDKRLQADGATSGFEKLYTKLIWEYFGGMYLVFKEALRVLKPGSQFSLLVSDSHAFKMVHISTADLLAEVALEAGLVDPRIELWQFKKSTSHKFLLFENILTVSKPT